MHNSAVSATQVLDRVQNLIASEIPREKILAETVGILKDGFSKYSWVGFYLLEKGELVLGPYQGKPTPHSRIKLDSGICGAAVREEETIIVDDVHQDPRYLACSLEAKSEIVVPIRKGRRIVAEIDIDSDDPAAFGPADKDLLEKVSTALSAIF